MGFTLALLTLTTTGSTSDSLILNRFCNFESYNSNERWILVQVRSDTSRDGQVWDRGMDDYRDGFQVEGALNTYTSYWVGLDNLHELTSHGSWKLMLLMEWESGAKTKDPFGDTINPYPRYKHYRLLFPCFLHLTLFSLTNFLAKTVCDAYSSVVSRRF